jgi:RHS repeat-associated protein
VYDADEHLIAEVDGTGTTLVEYIWLGDTPVAVLRNGVLYYVYTDHLNTPRAVTDTANTMRWTWHSEPFGSSLPNENPSGVAPFKLNLRFPGQYYDVESGLHYNYFRDYDPQTGRYVQSDPIGLAGGYNTYVYAHGGPLNEIDPSGLFTVRDAAGFLPVLGSSLDAYDAFKCGNYGWAAINVGLAVVDITGAGALAKGLTVGTMKFSSRLAIREVYTNSANWNEMRRGLQRIEEISKNTWSTPRRNWLTTDHIFIKQRYGLPHNITNHPANLQTEVSQSLNSQFEYMGALERALYLPNWMKLSAAGVASYSTGLAVGSGCGCH